MWRAESLVYGGEPGRKFAPFGEREDPRGTVSMLALI